MRARPNIELACGHVFVIPGGMPYIVIIPLPRPIALFLTCGLIRDLPSAAGSAAEAVQSSSNLGPNRDEGISVDPSYFPRKVSKHSP